MDELEAVEEALRDVADVHPRVGANDQSALELIIA